MQILAKCPGCGNSYLLDGSAADRRVRCPQCRKLFKIPHLDEVPQAVKVIRRAQGTVYVDEDGKTYG
jgi:predicted Zn finger-like uncharacterized protein